MKEDKANIDTFTENAVLVGLITPTQNEMKANEYLDELAFLADLPEHIRDLRPTAVHQHDLDADELQQHDIADDRILEVLGDHGVAAVFDDDDLSAVLLNIRQGMYQNSCPLCVRNIHGCFLHQVR